MLPPLFLEVEPHHRVGIQCIRARNLLIVLYRLGYRHVCGSGLKGVSAPVFLIFLGADQ